MQLAFVVVFALCGMGAPAHAGGYRIITDMDDRRIEVPINPKRIVCMHGVSSERIMILGKGPSMTLMATKPSPWAYRLFPEMKQVRTVSLQATPNLEDMVREKVDLLLYSPIPVETRKCRAVGIRTACGFSAGKRPRTVSGFMENFKRQVRFFGELLGPEARVRAERYCRYYRKVGQILARTSRIARRDLRLGVESGVATEVGGVYVRGRGRAGLEVRALRQGRIHSLAPYSASGRPDWFLGLLHMANLIHPELFGLDMERIADEFYARFLGIVPAPGERRSIAHPGVRGGAKKDVAVPGGTP